MSDIETALSVRVEASLARLEKQMARARGVVKTSSDKMSADVERMNTRMAASTRKGAGALQSVMNISGRGRFVLQNTAAQLGDIAVQLESGTAASRVMAQQLPQIFGGFGALGGALGIVAPLLGTVAAVGIPLAAMFLATGGGAKEAAEKVKTFAEKLSEAESALGRAEAAMMDASAGGLETLKKRYGEVTLAVRELAAELADIEKRSAIVSFNNIFDDGALEDMQRSISAALGGLSGLLVEATEADIEAARKGISELETDISNRRLLGQAIEPFLLTQLQEMRQELAAMTGDLENAGDLASEIGPNAAAIARARELVRTLDEAKDAQEFLEMANALAGMVALMDDLGVSNQELRDKMIKAQDHARRMAATLDEGAIAAADLADRSGDIAPELLTAAEQADRLARNLRGAMKELDSLRIGQQAANRIASDRLRARAETIGQPVERAGRLAGIDARVDAQGAVSAALESGDLGALTTASQFVREAEAAARALKAQELALEEAEKALNGATSTSRGGSRTSVASPFASADAQLVQIQRQIEMLGRTDSEVAALTARYRLLDEVKRQGLSLDQVLVETGQTLGDTIDQKAAQVGRLTDQLEKGRLSQQGFEQGMKSVADSMASAIVQGGTLGDVLSQLGQQLLQRGLSNLLQNGLSNLVAGTAFEGVFGGFNAKGNVFSAGNVVPFARGGVVSSATAFPMSRGRTGVMGEAGPEAIMPLARGPDGKLGVRGGGGASGVEVHVHNYAGAEVETQTRQSGGRTVQEITIREIKRALSSGKLDREMGRFGASPRPVRQ